MGYKPRELGHINIYVRNAERSRSGMRISSGYILTG